MTIMACMSVERPLPEKRQTGSCIISGCSSQLCGDEALVSTCEWREDYACYQSATCDRQRDGTCGWTATSELTSCLAAYAR
jgi:hypothetical protein